MATVSFESDCISEKSSSIPTPIFEWDKASFSWVYSSLYVTIQNHRIIKFQGTSVDCLVQPLCPKQCQLGQTSTVSSQILSISKNCDSTASLSPNSTVCGTKHWLWDRKRDEIAKFYDPHSMEAFEHILQSYYSKHSLCLGLSAVLS